MQHLRRAARYLSETFVLRGMELSVAVLSISGWLWVTAVSYTAFFGGHVPGSPVHFTEASFARGVFVSVVIAPGLLLAVAAAAVTVVTLVSFALLPLFPSRSRAGHIAVAPVSSAAFRRR